MVQIILVNSNSLVEINFPENTQSFKFQTQPPDDRSLGTTNIKH